MGLQWVGTPTAARATYHRLVMHLEPVRWCPGAESNHRHCDFQKRLNLLASNALYFLAEVQSFREKEGVPPGMWLEFGGAISGNMSVSFQAARSIS